MIILKGSLWVPMVLLFATLLSNPEAAFAQTTSAKRTLKVFPGAQGFGTDTSAGRGGKIVKVTNLNDSGPGSLREALSVSGPRIVVFEVGGVINLQSQLIVNNPYLTLAGQTAPPPGITLGGYGLTIQTHDVLVQHIFSRFTSSGTTSADDAIRIYSPTGSAYNVVIDHVSAAWGNDECISINRGSGRDFTISNSIAAEGNYGLLVGQDVTNASLVRNLMMGSSQRHPRIAGGASVFMVNNLSYDWKNQAATQVGSVEGPNMISMAGNVFVSGPNASSTYALNIYSIQAGSKLYIPTSGSHANSASHSMYPSTVSPYLVGTEPVPLSGVTVMAASSVETYIVNNVGARPAERGTSYGDSVDERLIGTLTERRSTVKQTWVKPVSGNMRTFNIPANPNGDDDGDGYTNIEEVLHQMAVQVER